MSPAEECIVVNQKVMGGKPIVRGTRVTVQRVLDLLAQGMSVGELLKENPQLTDAGVRACLAYAAGLAGHEEIIPLPESRSA